MLAAMLAESFEARITFAEAARDDPGSPSAEVRELVGPTAKGESSYIVTRHPLPSRRALREIPAVVRADGAVASVGLNAKLVVEEDVLARPEAPDTLNALRRQGFDFAGWAPSALRYGRVALVLSRPGTTPAGSAPVAPPDLSALTELGATRRFLMHVLSRRPTPAEREDGLRRRAAR
jgi:hypothetical protein